MSTRDDTHKQGDEPEATDESAATGHDDTFDWTDPGAVHARLTEHGQFADASESDRTPDKATETEQADPSEGDAGKAEASNGDDPNGDGPASDATADDGGEDQSADASEDDDTPRGVQTKNKGRVLPYHVLEDARKEASSYKQQVLDLQQQLEALQKHDNATPSAEADAELKEVLERLNTEEEFPEGSDVVKALNHAVKQANEANRRLAEQERQFEQQRQQQSEAAQQAQADEAAAEHNEAIESTPQLKRLWNAGGPLADQALAISNRMLEDESYQPKSRVAHYQDVEREMCELLGIQKQPEAEQAKAPKKPLPEPETPEPASLSDIPGGAAPETSEGEAFMKMDGMKAVAQLAKMDPNQQSEFVRRAFGS